MLFHMKINLSKNVTYDKILIGKLYQEKYFFNNEYPQDDKVYDLISSYYSIDKKFIAIGYGSADVLNRIIGNLSLDDLFVIEPTFHGAERFCRYHNVMYIPWKYKNFNQIDIEDIPSNCNIYIANPNGNNGHAFSLDSLKKLLKRSKLLIIDEAYIDYGGESIIKERASNLIVLRTFSKSLGLPDIRCGFAVASENNINLIRSTELPYCSTGRTEKILKKYINQIPDTVERMIDARNFVESKFECIKSKGNYVLLNKKYESLFKDKAIISYRDKFLRIALTNKEFFEKIWEENLKKH